MKINRIKLNIDFLNIIMNFFPCYIVLCTIHYYFQEGKVPFLNIALLIIIPFAAYIIRRYISSFFIFSLLHLICTVLLVLILSETALERILFAIYSFIIVLFSFQVYIKKRQNRVSPVIHFVVFFIVYLISEYIGAAALLELSKALTMLVIALSFIIYYLGGIQRFFEVNSHGSSKVPIIKIMRLGNLQLLGFSFIALITASIFSNINLKGLVIFISDKLKGILRFIFGIIFRNREKINEMPIEQTVNEDVPIMVMPSVENNEWLNKMWGYLADIFMVLTTVGIILLICYAAYSFYKSFYKNKVKKHVNKEFLSPFVKEESLKRKNRREAFFLRFGQGNNEKVRKAFYLTVYQQSKKKKKQSEVLSYTPTEFRELYEESEQKKRLEELAGYYGKARYSGKNCTEIEVKAVKKYKKELS